MKGKILGKHKFQAMNHVQFRNVIGWLPLDFDSYHRTVEEDGRRQVQLNS